MLPWQWHIRQPNFQKTEVFVVNLLEAIFGDQRIKGFREKEEGNRYRNCVQPTDREARKDTNNRVFVKCLF